MFGFSPSPLSHLTSHLLSSRCARLGMRPMALFLGLGALGCFGADSSAAFSAAPLTQVTSHAASCPADDASANRASPLKSGLDFVPVLPDASLGFHVAYSAKSSGGGSAIANNVGIFMFPLSDGGVLIFGAGYGDPVGSGSAANDAAYDVANVDDYVRDCLGQLPANTPVDFVSPHWHGDHINEAFIRELGKAGYNVRSIWFHEDDNANILSFYNWTSQEKALFRTMPDAGCNVEIGSFDSTLGRIWFLARSGHAAGAIDLVLDVRGNPNDRVLVRGSEAGGNCPTPPSNVRATYNAHGNLLVSDSPEAVTYGCGVNPSGSLRVTSGLPKLGTTIGLGLDDPLGTVSAGSLPLLYLSKEADSNLPCGTIVNLGLTGGPQEILIDLTQNSGLAEPLVGLPWLGPGQPSIFFIDVPQDLGVIGESFFLQGALLQYGAGSALVGLSLSEGLELRLAL